MCSPNVFVMMCLLSFSILACDCFMFGITNNGTCNQTTGQCECKQNVTGRQCDGCADTFWGFRLPPIGDCRGKLFGLLDMEISA